MILLGIPTGLWPYSYYILLRWVVFFVAISISHYFYKDGNINNRVLLNGAVALLFNPIFPFYFGKGVWVIIDLITVAIFYISSKDEAIKK